MNQGTAAERTNESAIVRKNTQEEEEGVKLHPQE